MDVVVLRALERAIELSAGARQDGYGAIALAYDKQTDKFHDYIVRKLEQGKMAKAEVKALRQELDECRQELLLSELMPAD